MQTRFHAHATGSRAASLLCGASLLALGLMAAPAFAQDAATPPAKNDASTVVVVTGQRAALRSAQNIKKNSDEVVDSIVADDIGKLPDRSVTEALQRVPGITIDHTMSRSDPEHYSVEGSGVNIRGLTYVRSELNGRDSFSANGGRSLNFEDVPPELMAGVDVYKNPSAEQIEGAIGGLVNLRTARPFDYKGFEASVSAQGTYGELNKKGATDPSWSALVSDRWNTGIGEFGAMLDLAWSKSETRTDAFQVEPYYNRADVEPGQTVWIPKGAEWRTLNFDRTRFGAYGALQWRPNDSMLNTLTYFKSQYKMAWDENAIFAASTPKNIQVANGVYGQNGELLSGDLSDPTDGGINFNDDTRFADRDSDTTDIAYNFSWNASDKWSFKADAQYIRSSTGSFDSTVATGLLVPEESIDLTGKTPKITTDNAYLADADNYYWAFTQEHFDKSVAHEWAWKGDAEYHFDSDWLRDLSFGARYTDRDATTINSNPSYHWAAITQTWQGEISGLAYLGDPRFAGGATLHNFDNFFNGDASVPAVVVPEQSVAAGYPDSYAKIHDYYTVLCNEKNAQLAAAGEAQNTCSTWAPATFSDDPSTGGVNSEHEKSYAFYTQLRFGFTNLKYPIDGNIGVRYVRTDMDANGYQSFTETMPNVGSGYTLIGTIPTFSGDQIKPQPIVAHNSFTNTLPSLNLRMKVSPALQFRFAVSEGMARPDFSQLQAYTTYSAGANVTTDDTAQTVTVNSLNNTGSASGNPYLEPTTSLNVDLTAEWYFSPVGSLTAALFHKNLHDVIINNVTQKGFVGDDGQTYEFTTTSPVNGASGTAQGLEIAYQQYFDKLPGWLSGLGVQANFTYVESTQKLYDGVSGPYCSATAGNGAANLNLNLNGCDTDGRSFGNLPLAYLSRYSYNLALLYDKGPVSARLAYNWRSKYLQGVNVNGTDGTDGFTTDPSSPLYGAGGFAWGLPTWADDYGQLDASAFYKITPKLTFGVEAQNINNAMYKQLMQQHIGMMTRAWFVSGPRYTAQLRYTF
jgi:TonB-dependent receptor